MRLSYRRIEHWPRLAWIARIDSSQNTIEVTHGPGMETADQWFCEAAWCGDFSAGDFDRTERIFGSGLRIRDDAVTFVSSGSTLDRLVWAQRPEATYVSNSLPCLMRRMNATVNPADRSYIRLFGSIARGIDKYIRDVPTSAGAIKLAYFHNLVWNGSTLREQAKPDTTPRFENFQIYRDYLQDSLNQLARNMSDRARTHPFTMLGTMSSGYDSATVSALGRAAGLKRVISFTHSKVGTSDSGEAIAKALDLELMLFDRDGYRKRTLPEVGFVSSDAKGEDIFFCAAEETLRGCAVLTGYTGDLQWSARYDHRGGNFVRGDRAGLSITEYRLRAGFLHCPIPYLGALHQDDLVAIANSDEMKPWDLGGDYSRPVARRILEEAGVPRGTFGTEKKAASVMLAEHRNLLSPSTEADFRDWLWKHADEFWTRGEVPPHVLESTLAPAQWVARRGWGVHARSQMPLIRGLSRRLAEWGDKEWLSWYLFPWAIDRAKLAYADGAESPDGAESHNVQKPAHANRN